MSYFSRFCAAALLGTLLVSGCSSAPSDLQSDSILIVEHDGAVLSDDLKDHLDELERVYVVNPDTDKSEMAKKAEELFNSYGYSPDQPVGFYIDRNKISPYSRVIQRTSDLDELQETLRLHSEDASSSESDSTADSSEEADS